MTSPIQVSEELLDEFADVMSVVQMDTPGSLYSMLKETFRQTGMTLAMKAAEPLAQGDEGLFPPLSPSITKELDRLNALAREQGDELTELRAAADRAAGFEVTTMTSSIQVTEEMIEAGTDAYGSMPHWANVEEYCRAIYLAMKAAEPLAQGDVERAANIIEEMVEGGSRNYTNIARAALVRSKLPIDRDAVALAMQNADLHDGDEGNHYRLFDLLGFSGENKAVMITRQLADAAITAIGSQSIEGERG